MFERVKILCEERNISIRELERQLGYSRNTLYSLKNQVPGVDKLEIIADYFAVSTDYLLGRTDVKEVQKPMDNYDIKIGLKQILLELEKNDELQYNGKPITEQEKSNIEVALEIVIGINESSGN